MGKLKDLINKIHKETNVDKDRLKFYLNRYKESHNPHSPMDRLPYCLEEYNTNRLPKEGNYQSN